MTGLMSLECRCSCALSSLNPGVCSSITSADLLAKTPLQQQRLCHSYPLLCISISSCECITYFPLSYSSSQSRNCTFLLCPRCILHFFYPLGAHIVWFYLCQHICVRSRHLANSYPSAPFISTVVSMLSMHEIMTHGELGSLGSHGSAYIDISVENVA